MKKDSHGEIIWKCTINIKEARAGVFYVLLNRDPNSHEILKFVCLKRRQTML